LFAEQAIDGEGGSLAVAGQFARLLHRIGNKQIISSRVNTLCPQGRFRQFRAAVLRPKKKGAPACAGAPQRSGHCRVCAQTV